MAKNNINIVISAEDKASKPIREISNEMDGASGKSSKFKSALGSLGSALRTTTVAAGALALGVGSAGVAIGFGFNSSVEQAQTKLQAFMGDNERVARTLSWVRDEAAKTQFSFTDMADAAANLTPVANSSGMALEDLVKQAEVLAAINPAEGLSGAAFSLREALSNDWMSIVDRFNLPRTRINQLKAEGVPAMEIISRTLKEMGIDYGLVAKQGLTVSARFDQVRDKLTMMAGAAAKPIFDRVSEELDTLGSFDFEGLGEHLAGIVSGAISAVDDFIPKVIELGQQIGGYLAPKLATIGQIVTEKLLPSLQMLWKEVIEPLVPVIGTALVGALGAAIDVFGQALEVISPFIRFLADNEWIIWGTVAAITAVKTALMLNAAFSAATTAFSMFTTVTIPAASAAFGGFKALLSTPLVMPAIAIAAALVAIAQVKAAYDEMRTAMEGAKRAGEESLAVTQQIINKNKEVQSSGVFSAQYKSRWSTATQNSLKIDAKMLGLPEPKFASGTNSAPGGWAVVNEHGPERRYINQGEMIVPAYRSRSEGSPAAAGPTIIIEQFNNNSGGDYHRILSDIGFALELSS